MVTGLCAGKLDSLLEYLDGLTARATVQELDTLLNELDVTIDDLGDFVRFGTTQYLRHLVSDGEWYHLLVLCWRSGQRSPIHNHAESTCGLRVLRGVATETLFTTTPSNLIKAVSSSDMSTGAVAVMKDERVHQVSNLQSAGTDLITLHVYSPALLRAQTYSLTEPTIGEFRPMILEHAMGTGI